VNVFIGEILTYQVKYTLYPGSVANLKLVDLLDEGLAFVRCVSIDFDSIVPGSNPCASPTITDVGPNGDVDKARQVEFDFGNATNPTSTSRTIVVTYEAVVLDSSNNIARPTATTLNNSAVWSWNDILNPTGTPVVLPAVFANDVTIVEPLMSITKGISPSSVTSGSQTTVTITINHAAGSNATAYDLVWIDPLPAGTEYVPGTMGFAGQAPTSFNDSNIHSLTATWDQFTIAGGSVTITFKIKVTLGGGFSAANITNIKWTSLPLDVSAPQTLNNPLSTERFYDPASPVNVYGTSASQTVSAAGGTVVPGTGFAPGIVTVLGPQPDNLNYTSNGLWLEIPALNQAINIVGVPQVGTTWDITWLGKQAGYLYGTAYPTWNGNSVITAHVYDADGNPGPFLNLGNLKWGDQVIIHAFGNRYIYQVRETLKTTASDPALLKHEDKPWVTLITCQGFDAKTNSYTWRIGVRAVLINVLPEDKQTESK
jgi:large repetitive protein